jgi:hypothetical protein
LADDKSDANDTVLQEKNIGVVNTPLDLLTIGVKNIPSKQSSKKPSE